MQASLEKIKAAREVIWLEEPADIARLRTRKGARKQGASAMLYAAMKLGQLVVFLNHLREMARQGRVDLGTMKTVTERDVKTLEEFVALTGELSLYIGRMDYWVDLLIPWAKFGEVYEQKTG